MEAYSSASTKQEGIGFVSLGTEYIHIARDVHGSSTSVHYDQPKVGLSLKNRMVTAEAIEAFLYASST